MAFQRSGFQKNAFQIPNLTAPPSGGDTHDGLLDTVARKFWEQKHIKHPVTKKRIKPKTVIKKYEELRKEDPKLPVLDTQWLYRLAQDKKQLAEFIRSIDEQMAQLAQLEIHRKNMADEELLIMICAIA
jgi:hypothetical protein